MGASARTYIPGDSFAELFNEEREFVAPGEPREKIRGLALSGGGIRSAAFALGVLQSLSANDRLSQIHYLSTVSGGGYAGTALTWFLRQGIVDGSPAGTGPSSFPIGVRAVRPGDPRSLGQNAIINYIRHHSRYLTPTTHLNIVSFAAVVIRSAFASLFIYFSLLTAGMGLLLLAGVFDPIPSWLLGPFSPLSRYLSSPLMLAGGAIVALLAWMSLVYSLATRLWTSALAYQARTRIQALLGRISTLALVLFVLGLLPVAYVYVETVIGPSLGAGSISTVLGAVLGAVEGMRQRQGQVSGRLWARLRPIAGVVLILYGLLLSALTVADWVLDTREEPLSLVVIALIGFAFGWLSNINYLGVHRLYRDRLMEVFMPNLAAVQRGQWDYAKQADPMGIDQVCGLPSHKVKRPYHLINANIVLADSRTSNLRARGGDAFLLSPMFCGSRATGWARSDGYMREGGGRGMTLATAMAISGAAVNPNTAARGRGVGRNRFVSMLLSLLNLRLGYWAPNPALDRGRVANFIEPGIRAGLFGLGLREDARLVELTDGGHFENLGVYELLRREVKTILVSDASADREFVFADLANLVERARVDFNIKIEFPEELGLDGLLPGSGPEPRHALDHRFHPAERGFAVGTIRYASDEPDRPSGTLVYFKPTMLPDLPVDVASYKSANAEFPHESTTDQFFDEAQFEAYRELGYRTVAQWVAHAEKKPAGVAHGAGAHGAEPKRVFRASGERARSEAGTQGSVRDKKDAKGTGH